MIWCLRGRILKFLNKGGGVLYRDFVTSLMDFVLHSMDFLDVFLSSATINWKGIKEVNEGIIKGFKGTVARAFFKN